MNIFVCADSDSSKNGNSGVSEPKWLHAEMDVWAFTPRWLVPLSLFAGVVYRTYGKQVVPVTTRVRCGGGSFQIRSQRNVSSCQVGACLRACVWLGCARGDVPCRCRNVSRMRARASLDAHHHHQQQLAANSDVGRLAHEPRTTHIVLSRRTKEESLDPLEKCSLWSLVVAHEARLIDWCCCATFFLHVQQGGFAHTLIMVSNSPSADALRSNVCVPTCWRDYWTRVRMIVVGGRRGACRRYVVRFRIVQFVGAFDTKRRHYPRRLTM